MFASLRGHASHASHLGAATAVAAILTAACSSHDAAGGAGSVSGTPQFQTYVQAICDRLQRCEPLSFQGFFADPTICPSRFTPLAQGQYSAPGATVTTAELDACTAEMKSAGCQDDTPSCAFAGTVAAGAPCFSAAQCATSACFKATDNVGNEALCGVCTARVSAGADCSKADCTVDLFCIDNKCVTPVGLGETCDETARPCKDGLACANGTCAAPLGKDAVCDLTATAVFCDPTLGLECIPTSSTQGKCGAAVFAKVGDKCGIDQTGNLVDCTGASCINGVCTADANEGQACDDTKGPGCAFPLDCTNGKCTATDSAACN